MKKIIRLLVILVLFLAFFFLPIPMANRVACIQAPCDTKGYVTFFQLLKEKKSFKTSKDVTSRQSTVSIKIAGFEKSSLKSIIIKSVDNEFNQEYQVNSDYVVAILNPGSYYLEQYENNQLIATIPINAPDSSDASKQVIHLNVVYE